MSGQKPTNVAGRRPGYLKLAYHLAVSNAPYLLLAPVALRASRFTAADLAAALVYLLANLPLAVSLLAVAAVLATAYLMQSPRPVYLFDFSCYKPGPEHVVTRETFMEQAAKAGVGVITDDSLGFQRKIVERSGLGQGTYLPSALLSSSPNPCMSEARREAVQVMFGAVDELLAKTGVRVRDISVVVVNCSLFSPTPSLSSMVVSRYKLRGNVASYNLAGMGCSTGLVSIDLAKRLLQVHRNSYALVASMENMTLHGYGGNNRSMLMSNCIFRMGGAAILLSNRGGDRQRAKYQLLQTVRTHHGADDRAFRSVFQEEDDTGRVGVALSKDLMAVAGEALKTNITTLGPIVLPMSEQILFLLSLFVGRKVFGLAGVRPYIPDFTMAFEHFCIHAGGRAVLDTIEKNLELSEWHMEPSRMTLYRWGNTSSSSLWYELAYAEAKGRVRRGHRAWQIAFGSGFKCNSAVWKALRTVEPVAEAGNPWAEEVHWFPVEVPKVEAVNVAAS